MTIPSINPVIEESRSRLYFNKEKDIIRDAVDRDTEARLDKIREELQKLNDESDKENYKHEKNLAQQRKLNAAAETLGVKQDLIRHKANSVRGGGTAEEDLLSILGTMQKESSYSNRALALKHGI